MALLLLLLVTLNFADAQIEEEIIECPSKVKYLFSDMEQSKRLFEAIRKVESNGNQCKISGNRIGPYQLSEQYYNEALDNNQNLRNGGKRFDFVWGEGSRNYSEMVIRSYVCRHAVNIGNPAGLHLYTLAAIHKTGSNIRNEIANQFRNAVRMADTENLNDSSEVCNPKCKEGQCCSEGQCFCIDNTNGNPEMKLCEVPCETTEIGGLDLVFVIDDSGSIGEGHFNRTKESVENIISSLRIGPDDTRVAVLLFSHRSLLLFDLDRHDNSDDLIEEIRSIEYIAGTSTNTEDALELLRNNILSQTLGLRPSNQSRHVAIVITDGQSEDETATLMQAELLHNETDFQVFAIGVGDNIDEVELMNIASDTSYVLLLDDFGADELQRFEEEVTVQTCSIPAPLGINNEVDRTLSQGKVTYFELEVPRSGATLMVDVNDGRVLMCVSRINQNPDCRDPSTYGWICETDGYCDVFLSAPAGYGKRRQTRLSGNTVFITIEGVERNNEIIMDVLMGDETISNVESLITLTDTVTILSDPLYEIPVTHTPPGMDPTTTSLCYQVHGENGKYYNLVTDDCIQVNVLYETFKNSSNENFIKQVGILTRDSKNNCTEIKLRANRCSLSINGKEFNESYNENEIIIIKSGKRSFEVTIPNCKNTKGDDIKFDMACHKVKGQRIIHFNVERGGGIRPGAHGLIGQFWNVAVDVLEYSGNYSGLANATFVVTVNHPTSSSRTFIAELHPVTWDGKRKDCLFAGSAQSGAINEVDVPNDHVIEGTYENYEVSGLFGFDFQYNQFQEEQCA